MIKKGDHRKFQYWPIFTISGIVAFTILYVIASNYYPGGSNFDRNFEGFNWRTNYWCELLGENAKNGQTNTARPFGFTAMLILSISMSVFWFKLPELIPMKKWMNVTLQISGVLAMFCTTFIYSHSHDLLITIAVCFGTITFTLTLYGLYKNRYITYFRLCLFCLLLIQLNNVIYLSNVFIELLPLIQKFTFVCLFLWVILVCVQFLKEEEKQIESQQ